MFDLHSETNRLSVGGPSAQCWTWTGTGLGLPDNQIFVLIFCTCSPSSLQWTPRVILVSPVKSDQVSKHTNIWVLFWVCLLYSILTHWQTNGQIHTNYTESECVLPECLTFISWLIAGRECPLFFSTGIRSHWVYFETYAVVAQVNNVCLGTPVSAEHVKLLYSWYTNFTL